MHSLESHEPSSLRAFTDTQALSCWMVHSSSKLPTTRRVPQATLRYITHAANRVTASPNCHLSTKPASGRTSFTQTNSYSLQEYYNYGKQMYKKYCKIYALKWINSMQVFDLLKLFHPSLKKIEKKFNRKCIVHQQISADICFPINTTYMNYLQVE